MERYEEFILLESLTDIADDDVMVLIDAFDVAIFPSAANIGKTLSESPTPIIFCAENGIYPEFGGGDVVHNHCVFKISRIK